ncbi:hypothetical protein [Thorsellia kenyensis]|uniref:Uncharacterized protein n=1 Tax=Thorsellia kenyensis TaxID=1549888 RepID=A0ABV6C8M9_9GAMM
MKLFIVFFISFFSVAIFALFQIRFFLFLGLDDLGSIYSYETDFINFENPNYLILYALYFGFPLLGLILLQLPSNNATNNRFVLLKTLLLPAFLISIQYFLLGGELNYKNDWLVNESHRDLLVVYQIMIIMFLLPLAQVWVSGDNPFINNEKLTLKVSQNLLVLSLFLLIYVVLCINFPKFLGAENFVIVLIVFIHVFLEICTWLRAKLVRINLALYQIIFPFALIFTLLLLRYSIPPSDDTGLLEGFITACNIFMVVFTTILMQSFFLSDRFLFFKKIMLNKAILIFLVLSNILLLSIGIFTYSKVEQNELIKVSDWLWLQGHYFFISYYFTMTVFLIYASRFSQNENLKNSTSKTNSFVTREKTEFNESRVEFIKRGTTKINILFGFFFIVIPLFIFNKHFDLYSYLEKKYLYVLINQNNPVNGHYFKYFVLSENKDEAEKILSVAEQKNYAYIEELKKKIEGNN